MRARLGAIALVSVAVAGCSGTKVEGVVREDGTGEPLPGAIVRIGQDSTRADLAGFYSIEVDDEDGRPQPFYAYKAGYEPMAVLAPFDDDVETHSGDVALRKKAPAPGRERSAARERRAACERRCDEDRRQVQVDQADLDAAAAKIAAAAEELEAAEAKIEEAAAPVGDAEAEGDAPAEQAPAISSPRD